MHNPIPFNVETFRDQFPIFTMRKGIYLDSAATTLTPQAVIDAEVQYYSYERASVGRSDYRAALEVSRKVEYCRERIGQSLNVPTESILIFCPGTTAAINMVAQALKWNSGDNIVTTIIEHSSNYLPWLRLRDQGVEIRIAQPKPGNSLNTSDILPLIDDHTRLVAVSHISNVTGDGPNIQEIAAEAHRHGALCVVDGAQAFGHIPVDLSDLNCDGYAVSAHKAYGPTGIGFLVLSGRALDHMNPPWLGGGMVDTIEGMNYTVKNGSAGWEAGTPNLSGILGFGASLSVREVAVSLPAIAHVQNLIFMAYEGLSNLSQIKQISSGDSSSILTFSVEGHRPHRVSSYLDETAQIMLRAGMMCAIPFHQDILGLPNGSLRISLAPYNTQEEIEVFLQVMNKFMEKYA